MGTGSLKWGPTWEQCRWGLVDGVCTRQPLPMPPPPSPLEDFGLLFPMEFCSTTPPSLPTQGGKGLINDTAAQNWLSGTLKKIFQAHLGEPSMLITHLQVLVFFSCVLCTMWYDTINAKKKDEPRQWKWIENEFIQRHILLPQLAEQPVSSRPRPSQCPPSQQLEHSPQISSPVKHTVVSTIKLRKQLQLEQ